MAIATVPLLLDNLSLGAVSPLLLLVLSVGSLRLLNKLNIEPRFNFFCDASLTLRFTGFDFFFRCGNELNFLSEN